MHKNSILARAFCVYFVLVASVFAIGYTILPEARPYAFALYGAPAALALILFAPSIVVFVLFNIVQFVWMLFVHVFTGGAMLFSTLMTLGLAGGTAYSMHTKSTNEINAWYRRSTVYPGWLRAWQNWTIGKFFLLLVWPCLAVVGALSFARIGRRAEASEAGATTTAPTANGPA